MTSKQIRDRSLYADDHGIPQTYVTTEDYLDTMTGTLIDIAVFIREIAAQLAEHNAREWGPQP